MAKWHRKLRIKNIDTGLYVETETNGKVTYCKNKKDAMLFRADGDESEADAQSTLELLNEIYSDCFAIEEN